MSSDIVRSYLGLLVQGKSDFDAIENHRGEEFYKQALGITLLPSSPTLRQRMDAQASALSVIVRPVPSLRCDRGRSTRSRQKPCEPRYAASGQ